MIWIPEQLVEDFREVARLAHVRVSRRSIHIEAQRQPHVQSSRLRTGKMAVYVFSDARRTLKVGKVGPEVSGEVRGQSCECRRLDKGEHRQGESPGRRELRHTSAYAVGSIRSVPPTPNIRGGTLRNDEPYC